MWEGGLGESDEGVSPQTSIIDQTENDMRAYESHPRWEAKKWSVRTFQSKIDADSPGLHADYIEIVLRLFS